MMEAWPVKLQSKCERPLKTPGALYVVVLNEEPVVLLRWG